MNGVDEKKVYGVFGNTEGRILEARIENAGAAVITLPAVEFLKIELKGDDREILINLSEFDWIIFTGVPSARYFIEALKAVDAEFSDLDNLRICSVGENVVHYLRAYQVHSDLIVSPRENDFTATMVEFTGGGLDETKFLVPSDQNAKNEIGARLKSLGAVVHELPLFRTNPVEENDVARIKALLLGGAVDVILFSNMDDILSLQWLFPDEGLSELLKDVGVLAATDDVFQSLVGCGLRPRVF